MGPCSNRRRGSYSDCITRGLEGAKGRLLHCCVSTELASLVEVVMNMIFLQVSRSSSAVVRLACFCSVACVQECEITLKGAVVGEERTG